MPSAWCQPCGPCQAPVVWSWPSYPATCARCFSWYRAVQSGATVDRISCCPSHGWLSSYPVDQQRGVEWHGRLTRCAVRCCPSFVLSHAALFTAVSLDAVMRAPTRSVRKARLVWCARPKWRCGHTRPACAASCTLCPSVGASRPPESHALRYWQSGAGMPRLAQPAVRRAR